MLGPYRVPHQLVLHEVVAVDQDVAERNDARVLAQAGGRLRVISGEASHSLADDLEVAFYGLPQQPVLGVVFEPLLLDDHKDEGGGVADVLERLRGTLRPHTGERESPPRTRRSGDSSRRLPLSPGRPRDRRVLPGPP